MAEISSASSTSKGCAAGGLPPVGGNGTLGARLAGMRALISIVHLASNDKQ